MFKLEHYLKKNQDSQPSLEKALLTGEQPQTLNKIYKNTQITVLYQQAMSNSMRNLSLMLRHIIKKFKPGKVFDLGGSDGALIEQLKKHWSTTHFTIFDLPANKCSFENRFHTKTQSTSLTAFVECDLKNDFITLIKALSNGVDLIIISNLLHLFDHNSQMNLLNLLKKYSESPTRILIYDQFINENDMLDASLTLTLDWINYGADFFLSEEKYAEKLTKMGFSEVKTHRFPQLPGAIIDILY